jgi:CRISPR-associated protein Cas5d
MPMHCLEVWGDFACFTRPEMKVERVSYDVMPPSAARAIFEAILWRPSILWRIHRIEVLEPIRWLSFRRNEVGSKVPVGSVKSAMKSGGGKLGLNIEDDRQQRAGLLLRDVRYRIHASFSMTQNAGAAETDGKFAEMFRRRAQKGQCFNQPYLGCREFACGFRYIEDPAKERQPIADDRELGLMLYDLDFSDPKEPKPAFFAARLGRGALEVPAWESAEVLR